MAEYIERESLLAEYDRVHIGPAGGARKLIEDAPAADVVPVKHGRWEQKDMFARYHWMHTCSVCGNPVYDKTKLYNYCPYCGARMDLKGE